MIIHGDCINGMKDLATDSIDLIVTDPPYGMKFMGKHWDKALPDPEAFKEMLRVLKPGAFAFVMCAPRSDLQARMSILLEDAGFNISFTPIYWTYATGFPKAQNISKQLAKKNIEEPKYNGAYSGYQPKPAVEVVIVAMKPKTEKTYIDQVLSNGKGVTWLDDCRIPYKQEDYEHTNKKASKQFHDKTNNEELFNALHQKGPKRQPINKDGRFPANLLVSDDSLNDGIERKSGGKQGAIYTSKHNLWNENKHQCKTISDNGSYSRYFDLDAWFVITPKPSKKEKGKYNIHPTVKPIKLMSYLITLGSRPGDIILDPFMGSGTTGVSAKLTNRKFIEYEMEEEYFNIAEARINDG